MSIGIAQFIVTNSKRKKEIDFIMKTTKYIHEYQYYIISINKKKIIIIIIFITILRY